MARIIITGGSGGVATSVRPHLAAAGHEVVLLDVVEPPVALEPTEAFQIFDATDLPGSIAAFHGADLVVHLAAHASERTWQQISELNIQGAYVVHEAARLAAVPRVVTASSIHATGFVPALDAAQSPVPLPRPDTFYGLSKAMLEGMGSLYADRFGHLVVTVRIMTATPEPENVRALSTWLSPADFARLLEAVLAFGATGHHLVWGVSNNTRSWVSLAAGHAIGYFPLDDAEAFADRFPDAGSPAEPAADIVLGGDFASQELGVTEVP